MDNRRVVTYSLSGALVLLGVIVFALFNLFSPEGEKEEDDFALTDMALYRAVPSDAVMVLHLESGAQFFTENSPLKKAEQQMVASLHYSAKNEVSLLYIFDGKEKSRSGNGPLFESLKSRAEMEKHYNSAEIYNMGDSLYFTLYGSILAASSSVYVLENSIRHLENGTSILDNTDFKAAASDGAENRLFINHSQIGKFFSGVTNGNILKHSDFFLNFASWSSFDIERRKIDGGVHIRLAGSIANNMEERYFSSLFSGQQPVHGTAASVLPATTAFAVSLPFFSAESYLDGIREFKAVHKDLNLYDYRQAVTAIEGELSPAALADSLDIEEIVAAYCSFGGGYDWVTLVRERESSSFSSLFSRENTEIQVEPYKYRNYMASLFGNLFSNCSEEYFCKIDGWTVIGPQLFVKAFARGAAKQFTLEDYLAGTPARDAFTDAANAEVMVNLKLSADSLGNVFKKKYASVLQKLTGMVNFSSVCARIYNENSMLKADIDVYGANLEKLPAPETGQQPFIVADSTIKVENGIFELKDFISGGKCYLEQLDNYNLRYMNGARKGLWTIQFDEPLCGYVEQIDFFGNGKLQMLFAAGDKLYLLDRLGRIVGGFPVEFATPVVLGPKVTGLYDGVYSIMVLDEKNRVAIYKVERNRLSPPTEIVCGEFVKELPELVTIENEDYLFVRTVTQTKIFTIQGYEITGKEKRGRIAPDGQIKILENSKIEYMGTDGKTYVMDLNTGRSQKAG